MPLPFRRPVKAEFTVPPAESRDQAAIEAQVEDVDRKLRSIAVIPRGERGQGLEWQTDRLLDLRNAIRPGRTKEDA